MAGENLHEANEANFEAEVLKSDKIALVDFWAEWCGPCRALAPTLEALAGEMSDKVKVYKLNVDDNGTIAAKYGVRSIPTVILFKNGQVAAQLVGNLPKNTFVDAINKLT